jgi:hypothetical protein
MENLEAKARCQSAREELARYRGAAKGLAWAFALAIPADIILLSLGFDRLSAAVMIILGPIAMAVYFMRAARRVEEMKPLPCINLTCFMEHEEEIAYTEIGDSWKCGFCAAEHPPFQAIPWRRTLVDPCRNCTKRQHSIRCWRCNQPIVWDEDAFGMSPKKSAWRPGHSLIELPPEPTREPPQEDRPPRIIDEDLR